VRHPRSGFLLDADPTFHADAGTDPEPYPCLHKKAQTLEKILKEAHIPYILACHLQINADPDPAYHFHVDPDFYLIRMRIQVTKMIWIHADPDPQHCRKNVVCCEHKHGQLVICKLPVSDLSKWLFV
jgi:hypothetical protein